MYYFFNRYFSLNIFIVWITEFVLIFFISLVIVSIRISFGQSAIITFEPSLIKASTFSTIYFLVFYYFDLYSPELYCVTRQMIIRLTHAVMAASFILITIYFLYPSLSINRRIMAGNIIILPILMIAWRSIFTMVLSVEFPEKRILIVGYGDLAQKIGTEIIKWYGHGLKLVGFIGDIPTPMEQYTEKSEKISNKKTIAKKGSPYRRRKDLAVIGGYGDIVKISHSEKIYKIIVAPPDRRAKLPMSALLKCKLSGIIVEDGETFHERITGKIPLDQLKPGWMVFSEGFRSLRSKKILKRFIDIWLSIIGFILFSPILLIVPLLIKLDSKGSVIIKQKRVGENEKEYELYKFRSMLFDAEKSSGPIWAKKDDPRITFIGKIIRQLRIDEIPQLFNVLKGDMSFVGPRPERPNFVAELKQKIPFYEIRTVVKPGITGWAQVKYTYGDSVEGATEKLQFDLYYIKNMSPVLDIMIIFLTIKVVLLRKGAR